MPLDMDDFECLEAAFICPYLYSSAVVSLAYRVVTHFEMQYEPVMSSLCHGSMPLQVVTMQHYFTSTSRMPTPRAVLANCVKIQGSEALGAKVLEMAACGKKRRRRAAPCQQALGPRCNLDGVNEV